MTNEQISLATVNQFSRHLWYLHESLAALSFFDDRIPRSMRIKMCEKLRVATVPNEANKFLKPKNREIDSYQIHDFVNANTRDFFTSYDIDVEFLISDPATWKNSASYLQALEKISGLKVVNDVAERSISLAQDFNGLAGKSEEQQQYLYKTVAHHRNICASNKKEDLKLGLESAHHV